MSDGRAVAYAQLRHEIVLYERARLRVVDDGGATDAYVAQLDALWAEARATAPRANPPPAGPGRPLAPVVRLTPR